MSPDLLAGRYEMIERLAGGGMGQVWRGRDQVLERIVAVKTVDLAAQDPTTRERFRREAVATAGLSAPNVVQVYDAGVDGDTAYLVMELLTGPSLSQLIHDHGPLPIDEGVHVTREIIKGLLAAHHIGVVHRDIKPGNVMYHGDQIKLVDFGIAQLTRSMGAQLTAPATALGTAAYMSPEQATGEGATEKSDWYALGCLMMTIFSGEPPFGGEALAVVTQQITAKPPSLAQRRPEVPRALDQLVARLLAKDPADRPRGEEVLDQLRLLEVDPNAGTILMPTSAPTAGTAVMPPSQGDFPPRRAAFAQTPTEPTGPSGAVVPAPPAQPERERKSRFWPVVLGLLAFLLVGTGVAYAVFNLTGGPPAPPAATPSPEATATPTPSATPTTAPTTTTRRTVSQPTTTAPTTTQPPPPPPTTTAASPTAEPTTEPTPTEPTDEPTPEGGETPNTGNGTTGNGNNGNSGNGNSGNGNSATGDAANQSGEVARGSVQDDRSSSQGDRSSGRSDGGAASADEDD